MELASYVQAQEKRDREQETYVHELESCDQIEGMDQESYDRWLHCQDEVVDRMVEDLQDLA
jgi:hypothetical protein